MRLNGTYYLSLYETVKNLLEYYVILAIAINLFFMFLKIRMTYISLHSGSYHIDLLLLSSQKIIRQLRYINMNYVKCEIIISTYEEINGLSV